MGVTARLFAAQPRDPDSGLDLGMAAAWILAAWVAEDAVRLAVGVIWIAFVAAMLLRDRLGVAAVDRSGVPSGVPWGSIASHRQTRSGSEPKHLQQIQKAPTRTGVRDEDRRNVR